MESNIKGYVHSIESMGTLDGPGIRCVVFMQGCMLKCKYCHNRDTWQPHINMEYTPQQLFYEIVKYKPYFDTSNGGVTISGGEPLLQTKFLIELFRLLKQNGIHTALDTSGSIEITNDIKELLNYTDLVLLDIKHIDEKKCIELTSRTNKFNLEFAKYLDSIRKDVWIRQVIVPTITDDYKDLIDLKHFLATLNNIKKIELLPYHSMGKFKWEELGQKYLLENIRDADDNDIKRAKEILEIE